MHGALRIDIRVDVLLEMLATDLGVRLYLQSSPCTFQIESLSLYLFTMTKSRPAPAVLRDAVEVSAQVIREFVSTPAAIVPEDTYVPFVALPLGHMETLLTI